MRRYAGDVAVLARKDLVLELRARDTLPAMLLFVISAFVVFHFALPTGSSELAAKGLLWVALVFTALVGLTRAFVAEREQRLIDGLLLAPCDRSAIWLAKTISVLAFLAVAEIVALPAFVALLLRDRLEHASPPSVSPISASSAVGTLLAAIAAVSRTSELILPLLFLPLAIPIVVGGVGASVVGDPGRYLGFLGLYDAVFAIISWASFEYVVSE